MQVKDGVRDRVSGRVRVSTVASEYSFVDWLEFGTLVLFIINCWLQLSLFPVLMQHSRQQKYKHFLVHSFIE